MIQTVEGIVLSTTKYSDNSHIVTMFTSLMGKQSFLVRRSKKGKGSNHSVWSPLSQVMCSVYIKKNGTLHTIKDYQIKKPNTTIPFCMVKSSLAFYCAELLHKSLPVGNEDYQLYQFLCNAIVVLENREEGLGNFHLLFSTELTRFLGFQPTNNYTNKSYFNLLEGGFTLQSDKHCLNQDVSKHLSLLLDCSFDTGQHFVVTKIMRQSLLDALMSFYKLHVEQFKYLNSISVLHTVLNT